MALSIIEKVSFARAIVPLLETRNATRCQHTKRELTNRISEVIAHFLLLELDRPPLLPPAVGSVREFSKRFSINAEAEREYSIVERALGPRNCMAKAFLDATGCTLSLKGRGSMRNPELESRLRLFPAYAHLFQPLHFQVSCRDTRERAQVRLHYALRNMYKILHPFPSDNPSLWDPIQKKQALINAFLRHPNPAEVNVYADNPAENLPGPPQPLEGGIPVEIGNAEMLHEQPPPLDDDEDGNHDDNGAAAAADEDDEDDDDSDDDDTEEEQQEQEEDDDDAPSDPFVPPTHPPAHSLPIGPARPAANPNLPPADPSPDGSESVPPAPVHPNDAIQFIPIVPNYNPNPIQNRLPNPRLHNPDFNIVIVPQIPRQQPAAAYDPFGGHFEIQHFRQVHDHLQAFYNVRPARSPPPHPAEPNGRILNDEHLRMLGLPPRAN